MNNNNNKNTTTTKSSRFPGDNYWKSFITFEPIARPTAPSPDTAVATEKLLHPMINNFMERSTGTTGSSNSVQGETKQHADSIKSTVPTKNSHQQAHQDAVTDLKVEDVEEVGGKTCKLS